MSGMPEQAAEKLHLPRNGDPQGLKPALIANSLRGPEGPLFHGDAHILESFRKL
jgi:hypothetical protein